MEAKSPTEVKGLFGPGQIPSAGDFEVLIDSAFNKTESIELEADAALLFHLNGVQADLEKTILKLRSQIVHLANLRRQDDSLPPLSIGDTFGGGIIFQLDNNGLPLKVALANDSVTDKDGNSAVLQTKTMAEETASNHQEAEFTDWELPSFEDLKLLFTALRGGFSIDLNATATNSALAVSSGVVDDTVTLPLTTGDPQTISLPIGNDGTNFIGVSYTGNEENAKAILEIQAAGTDIEFDSLSVRGQLTINIPVGATIGDVAAAWTTHEPNLWNLTSGNYMTDDIEKVTEGGGEVEKTVLINFPAGNEVLMDPSDSNTQGAVRLIRTL